MREIAEIFIEAADQRLSTLTVSKVRVSADMRVAEILLTPREGEGMWDGAAKAIGHATRFFRKRLAERLNCRRVPELRFLRDDLLEKAYHGGSSWTDLPTP